MAAWIPEQEENYLNGYAVAADKLGTMVKMKVKSLFKYVFFPTYRRSWLILRYLRQGYNTQEAMAKVGAIKA